MARGLKYALTLVACMMWAPGMCAQEEVVPWRDRAFRMPFTIDPVQGSRIQELQLYLSSDQGRSWRQIETARPDRQFFTFFAPEDGEYWFNLRTVDREGRQDPPTLVGVAPKLRVRIDTTAPKIVLRPLNPVGDEIGVEWQIADDDLDARSLRVDYRAGGASDWRVVDVPATASGRKTWKSEGFGPVAIRLRVRDRAGNEASEEIRLTAPRGIPAMGNQPALPGQNRPGLDPVYAEPGRPGTNRVAPGHDGPDPSRPSGGQMPYAFATDPTREPRHPAAHGSSGSPAARRPAPAPQPTNTKLVNSTRFDLKYQAEGVGKSGLGSVTLYWTHDALTWNLYGPDEDRESPMAVDVGGEGTYGFTLVATSGVGVGDDPPVPGDVPQVWVEVDLAAPEANLFPPEPGRGTQQGILLLTWKVHDPHLDSKPITLQYARSLSGPWQTIATRLDNSGSYQWRMPADVPFQFYVRLEARDQAGNVGRAESVRPVVIDLSRPRIKVLSVSPNGEPAAATDTPNGQDRQAEVQ